MEIGDIINTSGMGIIVQEENENDDLLVAMDGKHSHDEDAVYIMENAYQENDDDDCENQQYIVEEEEMEQPEEEEEDIEDMYNCNVCGMNFASIDEHIEQYHSNQEVILDVAEAIDTTQQAVKCEPSEHINDEDDDVMDTMDGEPEQIIFVNVDSDGKTSGRPTRNAKQSNAHQKETYKCNQCSQSFETLRSLSGHILNGHGAKLQAPRNARASSKQVVPRVVRKTREKAAKNLNSEESESDVNERSAEVVHTCEQCNTVFQTAKSLKWVLIAQ